MEVGEERERVYTYRYTVTTRMTGYCIKVGNDESHFNVSVGSEGQSHKIVSTGHNFRRERRAEAVSNRGPPAYQPTRLTARPNRLTFLQLLRLVFLYCQSSQEVFLSCVFLWNVLLF